jgi:acetyl-CoA C-acetyltransferase
VITDSHLYSTKINLLEEVSLMEEVVILSAARTPIGKYGKALMGFTAPQLGTIAVKEALKRSGVEASQVDECIMGNVLSAGLGQNPARQAAIGAGLPVEIGSFTVNAVCGSGMKAAMLAADSIKAGEYNVIMTGGMESMSNAPYILQGARWGYRMNDQKVTDCMVHDGLWDIFNDQHMGFTGEIVADRFGVTREDADRLSVESHLKAAAATKAGKYDKEIVPITIKNKKGDIVVSHDEGIREDSSMEALAKLSPAFKENGKVTAGNSSQLSDGAAAVLIASRSWAEQNGFKPLATIEAYGERGVAPELIMEAPIPTTRHVLKKAGMTIDDIDLFEHNEAFATASCAVKKELNVPDEKFNVNGGAVALGHPIGCSGSRLITSLLYALQDRNKQVGCGTLCLGGGNAVTMIIRRC